MKASRLRLNIDLDFLGVPVLINLELDEIIQLDDLGERIVKSKIDEIKNDFINVKI